MKAKLDSFERQIERSVDSYRSVSRKDSQKIETLLEKIRKSRSINIRISENVLAELKRRSQREGLPYQTLISSILHKYVTDQLIDEDAIRKSIRLLQR